MLKRRDPKLLKDPLKNTQGTSWILHFKVASFENNTSKTHESMPVKGLLIDKKGTILKLDPND